MAEIAKPTPNAGQQRAIDLALDGPRVVVITGGPGTGKSWVTAEIANRWTERNKRIRLAAPTGKAARRLQEATRRQATTIHRLLEPTPQGTRQDGSKKFAFLRNCGNPLDGDIFILDECSMVDTSLMASFMDAIPNHGRIIFVGDTYQLPPVGPGSPFRDVLNAPRVPYVELDEVMRQAAASDIVRVCHKMRAGEGYFNMASSPHDGKDLVFLDEEGETEALEKITKLWLRGIGSLPRFVGIDPVAHIQIISPTKKGDCGTPKINEVIQRMRDLPLFADGKESRFRKGDKVIQTRNDYDLGVTNGQMGIILDSEKIGDREFFKVEFDDVDGKRVLDVPRHENDLELGYAITVHRFQGSEAPVVIMAFSGVPYPLMERAIIYTGISRARQLCVVVGDKGEFMKAVRRVNAAKRRTHLTDMLAG